MERSVRKLSEEDGVPFYFAAPRIVEDCRHWLDDDDSHVVVERGSRSRLQRIHAGRGIAISQNYDRHSNPSGRPKMAPGRCGIRWHGVRSGKSGGRRLRFPCCDAGSEDGAAGDSLRKRGPPRRRLVRHGIAHGESEVRYLRMIRPCIIAALAGAIGSCALATDDPPPPQAFLVREHLLPPGPRITPFLQYQAEQAWSEDNDRLREWEGVHSERELLKTQSELRQKLLQIDRKSVV